MATIVKNRFFEHDGVHYFRGKASTVFLGSYGRKRTILGRPNFLDPDGHLQIKDADQMKPVLTLKADTITFEEIDASAKFKIIGRDANADATVETLKQQKSELVLVLFSMELGEIKKLVNADDEARDLLDDNQGLGRVAHEIWVVMTANQATEFSKAARISATVKESGIDISGTGGGTTSGKTEITLSEGSTFAYLLARPIRRNNQITAFVSDQQGGI